MKKILLIFIILVLCGCSKDKKIICTSKITNDILEYDLVATYNIYYKNSFVTKIEENEIYYSENKETLNYFYEYKDLDYRNLNDLYGGYTYNIELTNNKVKVNTVLDFSQINIQKMLKDKYISNDYIISNKLTISGIKQLYESKGAKCDEL